MKRLKVKLPHKLSELLELALVDLSKVRRSRGQYKINMGRWMAKDTPDDKCVVCLAGCVMAKTFAIEFEAPDFGYFGAGVFPESFSEHNARALYALDSLRRGRVSEATTNLGRRPSTRIYALDRNAPHYSDNPRVWLRAMHKLLIDLKAARL